MRNKIYYILTEEKGSYLIFAFMLLEAITVAFSLSIDTFVAGFAYGSNQIKIPMLSIQVINVICTSTLGLALLAGAALKPYLPQSVAAAVCFGVLCLLGVIKLLDSATKSVIRKHSNLNKELRFSLLNFKFILHLYANPEAADVDASKVISPAEATALAVSLSLDGAAVGFGAALGGVSGLAIFLFSFFTNALGIMLGCYLGGKIARKVNGNLSWLGGALLLLIACTKLM